ncbi:hypothetical protein ANN_27198 [Periplaneta americana]|uniref:Uncharacterized protein n=1 Tax=Periplaneta americana TaxID=6978 RepID=A0ABQ8RXI2_PERAM|nr:hypothetical protein ANN_27198 [Periplaneta americana]
MAAFMFRIVFVASQRQTSCIRRRPELSEAATPVADYLVEDYIDSEGLFPPAMWTTQDLSSDRTTNACEAFHSTA